MKNAFFTLVCGLALNFSNQAQAWGFKDGFFNDFMSNIQTGIRDLARDPDIHKAVAQNFGINPEITQLVQMSPAELSKYLMLKSLGDPQQHVEKDHRPKTPDSWVMVNTQPRPQIVHSSTSSRFSSENGQTKYSASEQVSDNTAQHNRMAMVRKENDKAWMATVTGSQEELSLASRLWNTQGSLTLSPLDRHSAEADVASGMTVQNVKNNPNQKILTYVHNEGANPFKAQLRASPQDIQRLSIMIQNRQLQLMYEDNARDEQTPNRPTAPDTGTQLLEKSSWSVANPFQNYAQNASEQAQAVGHSVPWQAPGMHNSAQADIISTAANDDTAAPSFSPRDSLAMSPAASSLFGGLASVQEAPSTRPTTSVASDPELDAQEQSQNTPVFAIQSAALPSVDAVIDAIAPKDSNDASDQPTVVVINMEE